MRNEREIAIERYFWNNRNRELFPPNKDYAIQCVKFIYYFDIINKIENNISIDSDMYVANKNGCYPNEFHKEKKEYNNLAKYGKEAESTYKKFKEYIKLNKSTLDKTMYIMNILPDINELIEYGHNFEMWKNNYTSGQKVKINANEISELDKKRIEILLSDYYDGINEESNFYIVSDKVFFYDGNEQVSKEVLATIKTDTKFNFLDIVEGEYYVF